MFQEMVDLLLREELEGLRLKLFILCILENSLEMSLNLSNIFFSYSRFFTLSSSLILFIFLDVQHEILGPVHSILYINFIFSSKSSS
jgi:hypothetical protein